MKKDDFLKQFKSGEELNAFLKEIQKRGISGMNRYKLEKEETLHILAHTGSSAKWIKPKLKEKNWMECEHSTTYIKNLDIALNKIDPTTESLLYHQTDYIPQPLSDGLVIIDWYLSTAKENYNNRDVIWRIKPLETNSFGRDISNITNHKYEQEVLFLRGLKLQIQNIETRRTKKIVDLIEVV